MQQAACLIKVCHCASSGLNGFSSQNNDLSWIVGLGIMRTNRADIAQNDVISQSEIRKCLKR